MLTEDEINEQAKKIVEAILDDSVINWIESQEQSSADPENEMVNKK